MESWAALVFAGMAALLDTFRRRCVVTVVQTGDGLAVETLGLLRLTLRRLPLEVLRDDRRDLHDRARVAVSTAVMLRVPGSRLPFVVDTTEDALTFPGTARPAGRARRNRSG